MNAIQEIINKANKKNSPIDNPIFPLAEKITAPIKEIENTHSQNTNLNITLNAIIMSSSTAKSLATITSPQGQKNYHENDKLDGFNSAIIRKISSNSVTIENENHLKELVLLAETKEHVILHEKMDFPEKQVKKTLSDFFVINSIYENGEIIGLRIRPKKDGEQLIKSKLLPSDIVIKINNTLLNNENAVALAIQELDTLDTAQFTVSRNNQDMLIKISVQELIAMTDQN